MNDDSLIIRQADLNSAVAAGVLERSTAEELVAFVLRGDGSNHADDEQLRLVTGFNDIFVTIGLALFLGAIAYLSAGMMVLTLPIATWLLAEIFTKRKRMALPSIVLLVVFAISAFGGVMYLLAPNTPSSDFGLRDNNAWQFAVSGLVTAGLIGLHWLRFHVPITLAAGCAALVAMVVALLEGAFPNIITTHAALVFVPLGLATFALAMFFDVQDRARRTRKSDMAFWLHLLAAPLIVHPLVWGLANLDSMVLGDAGLIFGLFAILSFVALTIDRRALLVSSLLYLGYALSTLLTKTHWGSETFAFAVLGVGAIVLILSVAWQPLRKFILSIMPQSIRALVPASHSIAK